MKELQECNYALFIGYEDQENLGLRYIMAYLETQGIPSVLIPFVPSNISSLVEKIQSHQPRLVGFSIIFQYTLKDFAELAESLRKAGIKAHFTAGGHFPTLRPKETLDLIPQLNSVVMFEGELTTPELLHNLDNPNLWPAIKGLAFRSNGKVVINPPRPLIQDLNTLPFPKRGRPRFLSRGVKTASVLGSRGCLYNCSYCSIRQFYGNAPGPLRRIRSPESVVAEMKVLFEKDGVRFFIFQDDDFAAKTTSQRHWLESFLGELNSSGLKDRICWKISCRVDDIDPDLLACCHDHGLIAVFLGVESGNPVGLHTFNKLVTVAQNISAIESIKDIGLTFNMGFMLFDPDSTFESIRQNLVFLRTVVGDGSCAVNFCKMLPYGGTPIELRLKQEGRLKGTIDQPDYDFLDARVDWYAFFAAMSFRTRNFDSLGLVERLGVARLDQTLAREFEPADWVNDYRNKLEEITALANKIALDVLEKALDFVETREINELVADWSLLGLVAESLWKEDTRLQIELDKVLAIYNSDLLGGYRKEFQRRPNKSGYVSQIA